MSGQPLLSLGMRVGAGHGLWSVVAFVFPAFALIKDESATLAMLLFIVETLLASALVAARLGVSHRAMADDPEARRRLHEGIKVLLIFVLPFSLMCAVLIGAVTFIDVEKGRASIDASLHLDRVKWMAVALLAGAVLDSVIAPVRSVTWLETGIAWQGSRTAVLLFAMMLGWPLMLVLGTSTVFFWTFFGLRLLSDVGSLRASERERIRQQMFGAAYNPGGPAPAVVAPAATGGTAPAPFSRAHARHEVDDPRRLPR